VRERLADQDRLLRRLCGLTRAAGLLGTVNKKPGFILTGQAIDGGASGSGLDAVSITILTPTGDLVQASSGAVTKGDVVITP